MKKAASDLAGAREEAQVAGEPAEDAMAEKKPMVVYAAAYETVEAALAYIRNER